MAAVSSSRAPRAAACARRSEVFGGTPGEVRFESRRRSAVLGWRARAGYQTPAFAGKNRLFLAHGRQRSLEGSWSGVTGIRRASCGLVGARAAAPGI